jgi:Holliday junction resolvase
MPFELANTPVTGRASAILEKLDQNITREAYAEGMNLSRYLETLDPSKDHGDTRLDAFQRVLRAAGLNTRSIPESGIAASTLEDVVKDRRTQHLAIEIIARAYRKIAFSTPQERVSVASGEGIAGSFLAQWQFPTPRDVLIRPAIPLDEVVGRTTGINGTYYKPFYLEEVSRTTSRVGEAAEFPAVKISTSDKTINLVKYGRRVDMSYESIRRIPIDLLSFYVQRIAINVEADKVDKALATLVSGDGNSGTAATNYNLSALDSGASGTLTLKAWLAFKMKFLNPLAMTTALAQDTSMLALMLVNSGSANIPLVALGPQFSGLGVTPINQGLRDGVRGGWVASAPTGKIVGFDSRFALERVFEIGGNITETDKEVVMQINTLVLSEVEAYDIIDPKATKTLNLAA